MPEKGEVLLGSENMVFRRLDFSRIKLEEGCV